MAQEVEPVTLAYGDGGVAHVGGVWRDILDLLPGDGAENLLEIGCRADIWVKRILAMALSSPFGTIIHTFYFSHFRHLIVGDICVVGRAP